MSGTTVFPDATIGIGGGSLGAANVIGAASAHAALADNSDASYLELTGTGAATVSFANVSLPDGAVISRCYLYVRTSANGLQTLLTTLNLAGAVQLSGSVVVAWGSPTLSATIGNAQLTEAQVNSAGLTLRVSNDGANTFIYRAYLEVFYVTKPVTTITGPSGDIDDTNRPTITWTSALDPEGGAQARAQIIVKTLDGVTVAQTLLATAEQAWTVPAPLPDGDYLVFVRVGQMVNGVEHFSEFVDGAFSIDVDLPAVPLLLAEPDGGAGWVALEVYAQPGDASTDLIELERSADDGETWQQIRTKREDGRVLDGEGPIDWEAPIGRPLLYRARAVHDYYSGVYASSDWATTEPMTLDSGWWLRHPLNPELALAVNVHSFKTTNRAVRQTVHNPAGRAAPVIISDVRGLLTGTIVLRTDTPAERAKLDELLDSPPPLLLRGPAADDWIDSYVAIGDTQRDRLVDKSFIAERLETLPITVVDRPTDVATTWPDAMLLEHWLFADGGTPDFTPEDVLDGGSP